MECIDDIPSLYGSDDRPSIRTEDGVVVIRASALGYCERVFWAISNGIRGDEFTPETLAIFAEGHRLEDVMADRLRSQGYDIRSGQDEYDMWIIPNRLKIMGHVDGIEYDDDGNPMMVWENKALGETSYNKFKRKGPTYSEDYAWQISFYMAVTGLPALYTAIRRYSPRELEENPELVQDDAEHHIKQLKKPPYSKAEIKKRAIRLYKQHVGITVEMPPCVDSYFCNYKHLHDGPNGIGEEGDEKYIPIRSNTKFDDLAAELDKARAAKRKAEADEKRIKGQIAILAPDETEEYLQGERLEIYKQRIGRSFLDKQKVMEALGVDEQELEEQYYSKSEYTKYTIGKKGVKW